MKNLALELINEHFGTNELGQEIEYEEMGICFEEVESENIVDFNKNAEAGQCSDIDNETYYKVFDKRRDKVVSFIVNENNEIDEDYQTATFDAFKIIELLDFNENDFNELKLNITFIDYINACIKDYDCTDIQSAVFVINDSFMNL